MLKLPYISGKEIREWYARYGITMPKRLSQEVAIRARRAEKKALGDIAPKDNDTKDNDTKNNRKSNVTDENNDRNSNVNGLHT